MIGVLKKDLTVLITTLITSGFAVFLIIDAFFFQLDALNGIIFITLPVLQLLAVLIGAIISSGLFDRAVNTQP
jgi:hypothetical protein